MTIELTDLDQIDLIQDTFVKTYSIYCNECGSCISSGKKPTDFAIDMFEKGWTASAPYKIKCPECSKK